MPYVVSLASGKGGVGKTTVATSLAVIAAQAGHRTVLVDLDVGGADAHLLLGQLAPTHGLNGFLTRSVESLDDAALDVPSVPGLRLVVGAGDTLRAANPSYATKRRLARHLRRLAADLVVVDVGAGCGYHALDFFLLGDERIVVSTPEPTAVMDVYKFVKLAGVRHVLSHFLARDAISMELAGRDLQNLEELVEVASVCDPEAATTVRDLVGAFAVSLIVNQVRGSSRLDTLKLAGVIREFVGSQLRLLGQVPQDPAVTAAVVQLKPLLLLSPRCPAADALRRVHDNLGVNSRASGDVLSARRATSQHR